MEYEKKTVTFNEVLKLCKVGDDSRLYIGCHYITEEDVENGLFDHKYLRGLAISYYDSEEQKFMIDYIDLDSIALENYTFDDGEKDGAVERLLTEDI
jgi:hypothetical protein